MYTARLTSGLITRSRRVRARSRTLGFPWYEAGDGVVIIECVCVVGMVVVLWWSMESWVSGFRDVLALYDDGRLSFEGGLELWS